MAKYASLDILEDASVLQTMHQRNVFLIWQLLRYKIQYYYPELVDVEYQKDNTIPDAKYDKFKEEYLGLCLKLGADNLVVKTDFYAETFKDVKGDGMAEIDFDRGIVTSSLEYIGVEDWRVKVREIEDKAKEDARKNAPPEEQKKAQEETDEDLVNQYMGWGIH